MKGKKMGLIVLGNREGNWKQTVKEEVKKIIVIPVSATVI